jgi:[FeFe] hydrogenase H-cluster maturation GTPase HydF
VLRKTQLAVVVVSAPDSITDFEKDFTRDLKLRDIPAVGVVNKTDLRETPPQRLREYAALLGIPFTAVSAKTGRGIDELKQFIARHATYDDAELSLVGGLVRPGGLAVLVTPIDKAAPKGRLILPQQQTIRDILECDAAAVVTKEHELKKTLESLTVNPDIVITDSQAFLKVSADTPENIPMTSFSILFARQKGDLAEMVKGLKRIESLKSGDKVLIAEGCTHHRQSDDIGKVKIPRWVRQITGCDIHFDWTSGVSYPQNVGDYAVIIHCGGCMLNRREMQYRISYARSRGVYITNYGMLIAYVQGICKRALRPFPAAALAFEETGLI